MAATDTPRKRGRPRGAGPAAAPATLQSLDRALTLLKGLADGGSATLSDIALQCGLPAPTAYRVLTTLQSHGFAEFDPTSQRWLIGIEAYRTGTAFLQRNDLLAASRPAMRALMETTGETANLAIRDGAEVVFISQIETQNPIRAFFNPGTRTPMHASGTGKALLAEMDPTSAIKLLSKAGLERFTPNTLTRPDALLGDLSMIRTRGWSFDNEERHQGMRCIGAAITGPDGEARAGISVSGPSARFSDAAVAEMGPKVRAAAQEVSRALGGAG